jgi:hypothetical protein
MLEPEIENPLEEAATAAPQMLPERPICLCDNRHQGPGAKVTRFWNY